MPTAPITFVTTSNKITSVELEWEEPASPNGIITQYLVCGLCVCVCVCVCACVRACVRVYECVHLLQLRFIPDPPSGGATHEASGTATGIEVFGLRGNTQYTVTIRAVNRKNLGLTATLTFTTNFGVAQPSISTIISNFDLKTYTFRIERFSDLYGPLRCVCYCLLVFHINSLSLTQSL